jgi:hypothetical protein
VTAPTVYDGWLNTLTGLGTDRDRRLGYSLQARTELTDVDLEVLYNEEWLARRIVELLPGQSLRKEPTGLSDAQWKEWHAVNRHELYPHGVFLQGLYTGRLFGGALILVGFERGNPTDPAPEPGPTSGVRWLDVVPWQMLTIVARETDANSPRFGLPSIMRVTGNHVRRGLEFHISRAIICEGAARAVPDTTAVKPWQSVLESVHETLRDYGVAWASVGNLLDEASIGVMKMKGLLGMLSAEDQADARDRLQFIATTKSMVRTLFLDADDGGGVESFTRTEVSFAALPQLMQQITLRMSGAAGISAARLFGQEPAGMNATGESDLRQDYDSIAEYRTRMAVKLETLLRWVLRSPGIELEWPALWEPNESEKATTRAQLAAADKVWYDMGALTGIDVARSRSEDGSLGIDGIDLAALEAEEAAAAEAAEVAQQTALLAAQNPPPAPGAAPGAAPPPPPAENTEA